MNYCSLHQHSDTSFLDSCNQPNALAKRAKELGMPAIALTDHGGVYNFVKMFKACKKHGIKFIPGCEFYFTHRHADKDRKSRHLTILARDDVGLSTLYRLITMASTPLDQNGGFYFRPRIDWAFLEQWNEGLICLTGCMNSPVNHEFGQNQDYVVGKEHAEHLLKIFGKDRLFVELQYTNDLPGTPNRQIYIPEHEIILEYSRKLAMDLGLRAVATNDSHYLNKDDAFTHEILKAIDAGGTLAMPIADPKAGTRGRLVFNGYSYHVQSTEEMLLKFTEEEVANSQFIADQCTATLPLKQDHTPKFDPKLNPAQVLSLLRQRCRDGWRELKINDIPNRQDYADRMAIELKDIEEAGLQNYFMIVWDVVNFCLKSGIPVGRGRGSAAGSLVSYLLRITDIDPIANGLIWERFWNRGRKGSMPDVDLDICIERRNEVVEYLRNKFGSDRVFPMCAISALTTKAAIKDVGKVVGLSFAYMNDLAKHVPHKCKTIDQAIEESKVIAKAAKDGIDEDVEKWEEAIEKWQKETPPNTAKIVATQHQIAERKKQLKITFDVARKLEDVARQRSAHACALLIADEPILGKVPLCFDSNKRKMLTAFDMYDLEELGYLKLDVLGLKTLDVCSKVYPEGVRGLRTFDDPKVYDLISSGNTKGVFQLESPLGRQWCKRIKPRTILELSDLNALLRPAVLEVGMADEYVKNRADPTQIVYIHDHLIPILKDTYGCVLYQEQMLELAKKFAGFSLSEADILRKAVGKKNPEELAKLKEGFIAGVVKNYSNQKLGEELWSWIEKGAEYGFNKSHSLSYAQLAYITAWMKLYHTNKFFWALFLYSGNEQKPQEEVRELFFDARKFGVRVCAPSVDRCNADFELDENGNIHFGICHIKSIGESSLKVLREIKGSTWDNILRNFSTIKIKSNVLEALILSGAFDYTWKTRYEMHEQINFLHKLTDKELPVFYHILFGDPPHLMKITTKKQVTIQLERAANFEHALQLFKAFLENENNEHKLINANRAKKLIEECKLLLETYKDGKDLSIRDKASYESFYLGIPATCALTDIYASNRSTHTVLDLERERENVGTCTVAMINKINVKTDRNGRQMAFLGIEDRTYSMDVIVFADAYGKYHRLLKEGRVVLLEGVKRKGSLLVNIVEELPDV